MESLQSIWCTLFAKKAALHKQLLLGIISCSWLVYSSVSQISGNSSLGSSKRAQRNPPQRQDPPQRQESAKQAIIIVWKCLD